MNFEQFHPMQVFEEVVMFDEWLDGQDIQNILDLGCGRGGMGALMSEHVVRQWIGGDGGQTPVPRSSDWMFSPNATATSIRTKGTTTPYSWTWIIAMKSWNRTFHRFSPKLNPGGFIAFHDIDPRHPLMQTAPCDYLKLCHSTGWEHVEFIAPGDTPGIDYNNRNELWEMGRLLMNDPEAYRKKYNMLGLPKRLGGIGVLIKP